MSARGRPSDVRLRADGPLFIPLLAPPAPGRLGPRGAEHRLRAMAPCPSRSWRLRRRAAWAPAVPSAASGHGRFRETAPMAWVLDLDGVLWLSGRAIPGSPEAVAKLRANGHRVLFVTNNSGPLLEDHIAALAAIGVEAEADDIGSSAQAAAGLLAPGSTAFVLGGPGVREALQQRGVELVAAGARPDAVVVGRAVDFDYEGLRDAS